MLGFDLPQGCEQLVAAFESAKQSNAESKLFVVLDPSVRRAQDDEGFAEAAARCDAKFFHVLWEHPTLRPEHRPVFLSVDPQRNAGSELLAQSLELLLADLKTIQRGGALRVVGWFASASSVPVLQQHLGRLAVQQIPLQGQPELGRKRLLRYFDPLVMDVLWGMLTPAQQGQCLGPIERWVYPGIGPEASLVLKQALRPTDAVATWAQAGAFGLDVAQWRALLALDVVNPALVVRGLAPTDLKKRPEALACVERLMQTGVREHADLIRVVEYALDKHTNFDLHPRVTELLRSRRDRFACAALSDLSETDWQTICHELAVPKPLG